MTKTLSPPRTALEIAAGEFPGIESDPETCGGAPRIAGTRVTVGTIMARYRVHSGSLQGILEDYPLLTEKQVLTAMEFYSHHREQIDADQRAIEQYHEEHSKRWLRKTLR